MNANINEDELKLLAYLHERAEGYDENFRFEPEPVGSELSIDDRELRKIASYLVSHGLVGMEASRFDNGDVLLHGLWLTGAGEDYVRELEAQPSVSKKITVAVVKEMGNALRTVAVAVLTQWVNSISPQFPPSM